MHLNDTAKSAKEPNENNYCEMLEVSSQNCPQTLMKYRNCKDLDSKIYYVSLYFLEPSCGDLLEAFLTFSEQCKPELYLEPYRTTKMTFFNKTVKYLCKKLYFSCLTSF